MPNPLGFSRTVALTLLLSLAATLLLAGTAALPLLDRDEPRFSHATIEMLDRGDWVVPYFNDEYRFDKPPLTYWLMAVGYTTLGYNELGARIHSVLAALAMTALMFVFGRRIVGDSVAFVAAFAWLTCIQVFLHGRLALADMPMILAVMVMQWALWELLFRDGGARWAAVLWLAAALGFLAKGPIALAVPAVTLLVVRLASGAGAVPWRRMGAPWGVPLALALVGAWGIPALLRTGGAFWDVGIGEHVVRRGVSAFNDRPIVPGYYLVTIFLSLFPWSPNLGQLWGTLRGRWREAETAFLLGWIAGPFVIFSFYSTQLPHYTLPAFPALLYLLFRDGHDPGEFSRPSKALYWGLHGLIGLVLLGAIAYAKWIDVPPQLRDLKIAVAMLAGALLALQGAAILLGRTSMRSVQQIAAPVVLVVIAASATHLFATTIRPLTAPVRLVPYYEKVDPSTLHVALGYAEPSLVFYGDRFWRLNTPPTREETATGGLFLYRGSEWGLDRLFAPGRDGVRRDSVAACGTVASAATSTAGTARATVDERARAAGVPAFLIESDLSRAVVCGFNFARSTWTELVVFYRESTSPPPVRR